MRAAGNRFADLDGLSVRAGGSRDERARRRIWDYSGAPPVDSEGQVVGVVTGADLRSKKPKRCGREMMYKFARLISAGAVLGFGAIPVAEAACSGDARVHV